MARIVIAGRDDAMADPERAILRGGVWTQLYERGTLQRVMTLGPRFGALVAALDGCGDETLDAVLDADRRAREYARALALT